MKLFVTAAWDPELVRFRELTPSDVTIAAIGIGLVDATAGMTQCAMRHAPTDALLLGTAGAMPGSGLAIGDVVVARTLRLVDGGVVEARAAIPFGEVAITVAPERTDPFVRAGAKLATVANTLAVTTDDALARALATTAEVEHLEAFGFARACALAGIGATVVLGIANIVGAGGRAEWKANHVAASARAAEIAAAGIGEWRVARSAG